ncbi:M28 family peptidase [Penaeicola halotolerans]|uniref:M28 family peptidase n=1 Tax=Penaeicola halotolerans TaxID=2793196 RepID=UPI001CF81A82|nr:M28 family peptidase [Penaeicola halotolerans]
MKLKNGLLALGATLIFCGAQAQDKTAIKYANSITNEDLYERIAVLSSDEMEGRDTGKKGQRMAAEYIANFYKSLGLVDPTKSGTYLQGFDLTSTAWGDVYIKSGKTTLKIDQDLIMAGDADIKKAAKAKLVFVGNGSEEEFNAADVKGNLVAILSVGANYNTKANLAKEKGAIGVVVVNIGEEDRFKTTVERYATFNSRGRLGFDRPTEQFPVFLVSPAGMAGLFGTDAETLMAAKGGAFKTKNVTYMAEKVKTAIPTENVVGFIEGTDKKEEVLVISSHYDHIGVAPNGDVFNGADDDASGTAAVMEIAEAFKKAADAGDRPRRSVLFLNVTGEEKGLLGSSYYSENPLFPLENTINNLNIDMIGRVDNNYKNEENQDYIYVIGSEMLSSHLKIVSDYANATYVGLKLDYRYDDENDTNRFYYRSDHYNFAKNNIPVIFYFNGVHDDYHKVTDTIEKIEFDLLNKRTKLVFFTAWDLLNRENRTPVDRVNTRPAR